MSPKKKVITIVESPRPEDDMNVPLPGYHDLLDKLCDRFKIPGSPTFDSAMDHIERQLKGTP